MATVLCGGDITFGFKLLLVHTCRGGWSCRARLGVLVSDGTGDGYDLGVDTVRL